MKTEWLIANITAVGLPAKTECAVFWVVLTVLGKFGPLYAVGGAGEPLCDLTIFTSLSPDNLS